MERISLSFLLKVHRVRHCTIGRKKQLLVFRFNKRKRQFPVVDHDFGQNVSCRQTPRRPATTESASPNQLTWFGDRAPFRENACMLVVSEVLLLPLKQISIKPDADPVAISNQALIIVALERVY